MNKIYRVVNLLMIILLSGCAGTAVIDNSPLKQKKNNYGYSLTSWAKKSNNDEINFLISFSGGGTRAAALAYGVLEGLRDSPILIDGKWGRMLDEIDYISSVSGGSFTAAYYGLHGEGIFEHFKEDFLLYDVQQQLWLGLFNPLEWFGINSRTEIAFRYYNKYIFKGATFADMNQTQSPLIVINASDLGHGTRFSFIQEYFDLICSDINSFPVAKAVTASSAVPIIFSPVVLKKYADCNDQKEPRWLSQIKTMTNRNPMLSEMINGIDNLLNNEQRQYLHLIDGGVTDNLGLHAIFDIVSLSGGIKKILKNMSKRPPKHLIVISVNASTKPKSIISQSKKEPTIVETINAISDVQLHRYNTATLEFMKQKIALWADELSTSEQQVKAHFIRISLEDIKDVGQKQFFNNIPTSFSLNEEQVDGLIKAGHQLLNQNTQYQQLLKEIKE